MNEFHAEYRRIIRFDFWVNRFIAFFIFSIGGIFLYFLLFTDWAKTNELNEFSKVCTTSFALFFCLLGLYSWFITIPRSFQLTKVECKDPKDNLVSIHKKLTESFGFQPVSETNGIYRFVNSKVFGTSLLLTTFSCNDSIFFNARSDQYGIFDLGQERRLKRKTENAFSSIYS